MPSSTSSSATVAARDKAEDITFGVELKFLLRQDMEDSRSRYGNVRAFVPHQPKESRNSMSKPETRLWQDNWEAVAAAIDAIPGVNATSTHHSQAQRTEFWKTHWMVYKANSTCPSFMAFSQNNPDWPVFDASAPEFGKYAWTPVEICSPLLLWQDKMAAFGTLTRILETINTHFDVVANPSTEIHVHAGRADGRFYSLRTMKRLASLFWLAQALLRAVKDPASPNYEQHYTWSYPMREKSRLGMAINRERPDGPTVDDLYTGSPDDFEAFLGQLADASASLPHGDGHAVLQEHRPALRAIWRAADHTELAHMLCGPERQFRRPGFKFHAVELDARGEPTPRTVEVRFLEGFIDAAVVPAWVRLCGELADLAADGGRDDEGGAPARDAAFYRAVAALLRIPSDWPLDAQFSAFVCALGCARVPRSVVGPLLAVVRKNHAPRRLPERD